MMKKILTFAVLMAAMIPTLSFAATIRVEKELGWGTYLLHQQSTATYSARTLFGGDDTTAVFSMSDAAIFGDGFPVGAGTLYPSKNDSLCVGYVIIYRDSTEAGSPTLTAVTASIQASSDGLSWSSAGSTTQAPSSGDAVAVLPIFVVPSSGPTWNIVAQRLRIVFSSVTGNLPACRAKLVYFADNDRR
jgi:hypothetical protein